MKIAIKCPFCGEQYELEQFEEGLEAECEKCGNTFTISMNMLDMSPKTNNGASQKINIKNKESLSASRSFIPKSKNNLNNIYGEGKIVAFFRKNKSLINHLLLLFISLILLCLCLFILILAVVTEKTYYEYDVRSFYPERDKITGEGKRVYGTDIENDKGCFSAFKELVATIPVTTTEQTNYGDSRYVTGLRSNTNTTSIIFIYREKKTVRFYQLSYWK